MTSEVKKNFYLVSLPISSRAALPSLRVLIINQEKKEKIKTANRNSEINKLLEFNYINNNFLKL